MIINITFIVTFRWLLRRKQRIREKKRQSLMRDGGMYGYYSDDDEEDNDSRDRGYDPGGDLDADGNYLEDRGFLQYVAPSKANKTRTGSEASFDRWVDRVQEVAPSGGGGSGSGFDGGLAPVPEGAEDLEAVRGSREDGGDEDMAVFVTTEPVEWRNERQEWEPATILEVCVFFCYLILYFLYDCVAFGPIPIWSQRHSFSLKLAWVFVGLGLAI